VIERLVGQHFGVVPKLNQMAADKGLQSAAHKRLAYVPQDCGTQGWSSFHGGLDTFVGPTNGGAS